MRCTSSRSGANTRLRAGRGPARTLLGSGASSWLAAALIAGCAAQGEDPERPDGSSGNSSGGSVSHAGSPASGGSLIGAGGSAGTASSSGGSAGKATGGSNNGGGAGKGSGGGGTSGGGTAGTSAGGTGGSASGGTGGSASGGSGGSVGSGGSGGKGGAGGSGGNGGSAGKGGSGGSGGTPVDTCTNTTKDGSETDVDCGGNCTAKCATDEGCSYVGDCVASNVCDTLKCRQDGCTVANCAYGLTRYVLGASGAKGQAFVTWDATNLVVEFQISDATDLNDSDLNWEDDSVEIYLDLNNAKTAAYEADDFQITVPRAAGALSGSVNYTAASIGVMRTSNAMGYTIEVTIPWSALNGAASPVGTTIGFDLGFNDDNAGGTRDGQVILYGDLNDYQNTSKFGSLMLTP